MDQTAKNPVLKNYSCKPVPKEQCILATAGGIGVCPATPISATTFAEKKADGPSVAIAPELGVPIPGLVLKPIITEERNSYSVPWIGQYISAAYNYLIGAAVIAAAIMMTYGGFLYIVGSSSGTISSARSIMSDALIGLLLLIITFTLLKTFASGTVTTNTINIANIKPVGIALEQVNSGIQPASGENISEYLQATGQSVQDLALGPSPQRPATPEAPTAVPAASNGTTPGSGSGKPDCNPKDKILRYAQAQSPWGGKPFGNKPLCTGDARTELGSTSNASCCMAYGDSACGPTALAMLLKAYGESVTPETVGKLGIDNNLRNCNVGGMSPEALISLNRYPDFVVDESIDDTRSTKKKKVGKNIPLLDKTLREGKPVIFLCGGCTVKRVKNGKFEQQKTFGGHFMLLTGIYDDGHYAVNDPSMGNYNFVSRKEIESPRTSLIFIRRKDNATTTVCK